MGVEAMRAFSIMEGLATKVLRVEKAHTIPTNVLHRIPEKIGDWVVVVVLHDA